VAVCSGKDVRAAFHRLAVAIGLGADLGIPKKDRDFRIDDSLVGEFRPPGEVVPR